MNAKEITAAAVGATIWDDKVKGLHLRVTAGKRAFYLYYRTKTRVERRPKIGDWPVITVEKARDIAAKWLRAVAEGGDPVADWRREAAVPTVKQLAEEYMAKHGDRKRTGPEDKRMLDAYVLPRLGSKRTNAVSEADMDALHSGMFDTPHQANRVLALCSKMFALAERWGHRPKHSNPCHGIQRFREAKRVRYLRPDEAATFIEKLTAYSPQYPQQAAFLWLLLFTGARPSEVAAITPDAVDGTRVTLKRHKTDRTGAVRTIHLPPQAVEVIERLPRSGKTLLGIVSPRHLWDKITGEMGVDDLRMYDLRHSFASAGLMAGLSLPQIGELLGHRSTQTTSRYAHLIDDLAAERATMAADFIQQMATKAAPSKPDSAPAPRPVQPIES